VSAGHAEPGFAEADRTLDPRRVEEALARGLRDLAASAGAEAAHVLLRTRPGARSRLRCSVGLDAAALVAIGEATAVGLTAGAIPAPGEVVAAPELARSGPFGAIYASAGFAALAVVPLDVEGLLAGVAHILARSALAAAPAELYERARPLAPLALALCGLENARAAEERGEVVAQVAQGVLRHLDLAAVFPELIRLVARLCPCDAAAVALYRPETDTFEHVAVYGPMLPGEIRKGVTIPANETPMMRALRSDEIVSDPDGRTSGFRRARVIAQAGIVSSLYIPIGNPRRGVFCVGHRLACAFGEEEIELYRSLGPFLEIALRNAELVGRIREAYRELDSTQERFVRSERLRALGELAAGVAHDIGNVLAIVASNAELMAQRATDEETKRLVAACVQSAEDGARAVRRVLDLARAGAISEDAGAPSFLLETVVREAASFTAPLWREKGYDVDLSGVRAVPETPGDAGEVREAIVNLVLNALDAMPGGGRVALATRIEEDRVLFTIEDSGPGVPEAARERVFEPFYTSKGPGHAGLGLARVSRVMRQVGGSVEVGEASLGGARFELRFPIQELGSGPHELARPSSPAQPVRPTEVLLVEDEPVLRRALSALLTLRGHVVLTAGDVTGALDVLEQRPTIQVLVTDLGLPGRSGWELVDEVRKRSRTLPIIVLSGVGALTDPAHARERGVSAILAKPTTEQELAGAIESLVPSSGPEIGPGE
jgi:signal transduction histidine kinase/ActR/RegA family two-component response regulator